MYGKLENGKLHYAPKVLYIDGMALVNPSHDALAAAGYLPVKLTDAPKVEAGFIAMPSWEQTENEIVQKWKVFPDMNPLSVSEVMEMLIPQQVNTLAVDDNTALRMLGFYPEWEAGTAYTVGFKVRKDGKLWRVIQAHTSQAGWEPENAASLFEQINETHAGTIDDPIPYDGNMALTAGLYYMQDWEIYLCTRDTVNPVFNPLKELTSIYVEKV